MALPTKKSEIVKDTGGYTYLLYGQPKVGKTTFCSNFEGALFICTEPGHKFLKVFKDSPKKWEDVIAIKGREGAKENGTIADLLTTEHKFKTIIFDTIDNLFKMIETYICKKHNIPHPRHLSYGEGYSYLRKELERVVLTLTQAGYGVIFISHAQNKEIEVKNVTRNRTDTTMPNTASKVITGICDFILYCDMDDDGNRYMITKPNPNLNAGDRMGLLPERMPLDYGVFKKELLAGVELIDKRGN